MTESIKEKVNQFVKILEIQFPDLFVQFEQKVKKLFEIAQSIVKEMDNFANQQAAAK